MRQRETYRLDKLQKFIKGEEKVEELTDSNADVNMRLALERVEDEFEITFKQRQEKFDAKLREYERMVDEKKAQYHNLNKDLLKAGALKQPKPRQIDMIDIGVQAFPEERRELSPAPLGSFGVDGDVVGMEGSSAGGESLSVAQDDVEESQLLAEGPAREQPVLVAELPALGRRASGISEEVEQEALAAFNMGLQNARDAL